MELEKANFFSRFRLKVPFLMHPTPSHDHRSTVERYAFYERRIRGISTAIWRTQMQLSRPMGIPPKENRVLPAYRGLATLLSHSSSDGGAVTVTGRASDPLHITVISPRFLGHGSSHSQPRGAQPSGKPSISVEKVCPSDSSIMRDLPELARHGHAPVDLVQHTLDIFHSLLVISRSESVSVEVAVCRFILSRSWVEVKARLEAAQHLLNFSGTQTLVGMLQGWTPLPQDVSVYKSAVEVVRDPHLAYELRQQRIPMREYPGETHFSVGVNTASFWMKTLCKLFKNFQDATGRYASSDNDPSGPYLTMMAKNMRVLALLLRTRAIQYVFNSPSLHSQLKLREKSKSTSPTSLEPTTATLSLIEDELKTGEMAGHHVLRYLCSVVSWYNAASFDLPNIMRRFADSPPVIHIVKVPILRPDVNLKMHSPIFIARDELNKFLTSGDIEYAYTRRELQNFNTALDNLFPKGSAVQPPLIPTEHPCEDFLGSVHSVAVSLAVINGDSSSSPDPASPHWTPIEFRSQSTRASSQRNQVSPEYLVKPCSENIASSSRRCCYCCSLLEEMLSSTLDRGVSSSDSLLEPTAPFKDHYGVVVPWTPPSFGYGISLKTLALLERELRAVLLGGILNRLDHVFSTTNEARAHFEAEMLAPRAYHHHSSYIPEPDRRPSLLSTISEVSESSIGTGSTRSRSYQ